MPKLSFSSLASQQHLAIHKQRASWRIGVGWSMGEGMTALHLGPLLWFVGAKFPHATKNGS